ncbi:MAG: MATE family efflux transporter [Clostridia bacterium]|nr:MATE family efflux transporter [Clostridia bacterium]
MAKQRLDLTDERHSPLKIILYLAWPLFLEQILSTLVSFADTAMVGSVGKAATAAISISNSFVFLINGVVMALGVGITAYVARSVGAKDYEAAKSYIRHALLLLLIVGLPLALLPVFLHKLIPLWMGAEEEYLYLAQDYLLITSSFRIFTMAMMVLGSVFRGRGDTKTPLRINIVVNILNVVGNYLLIHEPHTIRIAVDCMNIDWSFRMFGAGLGVRGAALSTGFSWFLGGTTLAVMLFIKKDPTRISLKDSYKPDKAVIGRVVSLSIPAMLERMCMSLSGIVVTKSIATLGTVAVASNTVYSTAESLSFMPAFAFATSATTLVGQSLGAKKPELAKRYVRYTVLIGVLVMLAAGAGLYIFANPMVRIISKDADVIPLAMRCLRIVAFVQPIQVIAWILAGALRGAGDTRWPFYITAAGNWLIRALGAVLCIRVFHLGLPEAVTCMCFDQAVRAFFMFLRYRSGRWINAIKDKKPRLQKAS